MTQTDQRTRVATAQAAITMTRAEDAPPRTARRTLWVVVTESYAIPVDATTDEEAAALEAIQAGDLAAIPSLVTPTHTVANLVLGADPELSR